MLLYILSFLLMLLSEYKLAVDCFSRAKSG
jgi:hypothetical protein